MDTYEIRQAIFEKNYDRFKQLIDSGLDISQQVFDNNTVLHLMACVNWELSTAQSVKSIFQPTPRVMDWLARIRLAMPNAVPSKEFFTRQNDMGQTCMHVAITSDNWIFANAALSAFHISYFVDPGLYRRDQGGLTERERFLILYGIKGRKDEFEMLFDKAECSIRTIKSASKAFKIINLNHEKFAVLANTHRFYKWATELSYPEPYAEIEDPFILEQVYEEHGVVDPTKESRDRNRSAMQSNLDHLHYDGWLDEDPNYVLEFLRRYVDALWSWNRDKNYINTCAREFCQEVPSFYMANLREDIVSDLGKLSKLPEFSQHANIISKLIVKFGNLRSENE